MKHLFILLVLCFSVTANGAEPLKISCAEGSSSQALIPLVQAIYAELGIPVEIVMFPAERALYCANGGTCDADVARSCCSLSGFPNLMFTDVSINSIQLHAWTLKGSPIVIDSVDSLSGLRIAYVRGLKLAESFSTRENLNAQVLNTFDSAVKMLLADRIDVILSVCPSSFEELTTVASPSSFVLDTAESYHVLNIKHASLAPRFDAVLSAMKKDGRYQQLVSSN